MRIATTIAAAVAVVWNNNTHCVSSFSRSTPPPLSHYHSRWTAVVVSTSPQPLKRQRQRRQYATTQPLFSSNDGSDVETTNHQQRKDRQTGLLVLATVPLAWGTFEPAVRYVYSVQVDPPLPGFLFSLSYYVVAALTLVAISVVTQSLASPPPSLPADGDTVMTTLLQQQTKDKQETNDTRTQKWSRLVRGGSELGSYLFLGNALQVLGLKTVPSDRAAFLLQLTTIFVPFVDVFFFQSGGDDENENDTTNNSNPLTRIPLRTWIACLVALVGVGVMQFDTADEVVVSGTTLSSLSLSTGDWYIVAAAVAYTFHCIRLDTYAALTPPVQLAAAKAITETAWSVVSILAVVGVALTTTTSSDNNVLLSFAQDTGRELIDYGQFLSLQSAGINTAAIAGAGMDWSVVFAILWTGWVTVAYTIFAQSYGQGRVQSPVTANLIYTVQPICTALFAYILLHERLGFYGYVGASLIGAAVYLVATATSETTITAAVATGTEEEGLNMTTTTTTEVPADTTIQSNQR